MEISNSQIEKLRNEFLDELKTKGESSIHPRDLERVKTSDAWLKRFLLHFDGELDKALAMLWGCVLWRNDFKVNEINEQTIKMDILIRGGLFPHSKDIDGCHLLIFKCKLHTKGSVDMHELKRVVVYWFERLERETQGNPISIFFDMEGCGLSNMDMEFTKYLINLFKDYYPFFLNYILIFEMPWVLSAAFKIIKSWLPEKAVEKIKFVSKKDIQTYVPLDQALKCWGGEDNYSFSFVSEAKDEASAAPVITNNNKKVHFLDGSSMSDTSTKNGDKDNDGNPLKVRPSGIISFVKEGNEMVSSLEVQNTDALTTLSFKLKTTSPEKFRVKPSTGCLTPGASASITITLLEGFQLGGLSRDKFLVMSTVVDSTDMSGQELSDLWKNTSGRKICEHRLKCIQNNIDMSKNGSVPGGAGSQDTDVTLKKLSANIAQLNTCQSELHSAVKRTQYYQLATIILFIVLGAVLSYLMGTRFGDASSASHSYCSRADNSP